jgi:Photosynthetic reaction centre cytochrome C subunit
MTFNRKFLVVASMAAVVMTAVAFTSPAPAPPADGFKNLKILDKDISNEKLHKIMRGFNDALGVKCNFCHAPSKDTAAKWPDFASDEKPEKNIARSMMKMTLKINKKFFEVKHPFIGDSTLTVTCITCHHGNPHPEGNSESEEHMDHPPGPPPGNH